MPLASAPPLDLAVFILLGGAVALPAWLWFFPRIRRFCWPFCQIALLAAPFFASTPAHPLRLVCCGLVIIWSAKLWETTFARISDPAMATSFGRYWLAWTMPWKTTWPRDEESAQRTRRAASMRAYQGITALFVAVTAVALNQQFRLHYGHWLIFCAWSFILLYTTMAGLADVLAACGQACGVAVAPAFDSPHRTTSLADFWRNRWNRFVSDFVWRHVFWAVGGRRRPRLATMMIFLASGVMHEYLLLAVHGSWSWANGWHFGFFATHGVVVVATAKSPHLRNRKLRQGLTWLWLAATSPAFFYPLDHVVAYSRWHIWGTSA